MLYESSDFIGNEEGYTGEKKTKTVTLGGGSSSAFEPQVKSALPSENVVAVVEMAGTGRLFEGSSPTDSAFVPSSLLPPDEGIAGDGDVSEDDGNNVGANYANANRNSSTSDSNNDNNSDSNSGKAKTPYSSKKILPWSKEEDDILEALVKKHGSKSWTVVSEGFHDRTGKHCRERWLNHVNPDLKKGEWTEADDNYIISMQKEMGNQWAKITKNLPGRTDNAVKNRFYAIHRAELKERERMRNIEILNVKMREHALAKQAYLSKERESLGGLNILCEVVFDNDANSKNKGSSSSAYARASAMQPMSYASSSSMSSPSSSYIGKRNLSLLQQSNSNNSNNYNNNYNNNNNSSSSSSSSSNNYSSNNYNYSYNNNSNSSSGDGVANSIDNLRKRSLDEESSFSPGNKRMLPN